MSNSGFQSDRGDEDLFALIRMVERQTRWNMIRFLVLSALLVTVVAAVSYGLNQSIQTLENRQLEAEEQLREQRAEAYGIEADIQVTRDAVQRLEAVLRRQDPASAETEGLRLAHAFVGRTELSDGEQEAIQTAARRVAAKDEETAEQSYLEGVAFLQDGKAEDAGQSFRRAIERESDYDEARVGLGRANFEADQFDMAVGTLSAAGLEEDAGARMWRARARIELGDHQAALTDCQAAIRLEPGSWAAHNTCGFANLLLDKYPDARRDWEEAARLRADRAYAVENIGLIYMRTEDWRGALNHTAEFNREFGGSSWNWMFQGIAADQLGLEVVAQIAFQRWNESVGSTDRDTLRTYLQPSLHGYLDR